jgi:hypothetical protein
MAASPLPNPARGEVLLRIDAVPRRLCLTLGALARLEAALDCREPGALEARLRALSSADLLTVVAALAVDDDLTPEALAAARLNPVEAAAAVAAAFQEAFA